jgi:hypothetical protein
MDCPGGPLKFTGARDFASVRSPRIHFPRSHLFPFPTPSHASFSSVAFTGSGKKKFVNKLSEKIKENILENIQGIFLKEKIKKQNLNKCL